MYYFVKIIRNGTTLYVISPKWGEFALSAARDRNLYLWFSEQDAREATKHLIQEGDVVETVRTYRT
jgi:hypothetical protein